ncbi:MAG: type II toxin-antitoxin system PemK/MazF family toxin [Gloeobacterales cyanobacterium]
MPTLTYEQFAVVVVPFPFTDIALTKRRPALILSDTVAFNALMGHSVMAMITTATHAPWALDVPISNLKTAGLKAPSIIRMKLFTLDHSLVLEQIGKLESEEQVKVEQALRKLFKVV